VKVEMRPTFNLSFSVNYQKEFHNLMRNFLIKKSLKTIFFCKLSYFNKMEYWMVCAILFHSTIRW